MATYTIVDKDKDPLDPGEINAGETISVTDGDIFIIDPSADGKITFVAAGGIPADFEVRFETSNTNGFDIKFEEDLSPTVKIYDDADLDDIKIDAKNADAVTMNMGDNVSLGKFGGSESGVNAITIGDGFTTTEDWKFGDGNDTIRLGKTATLSELDGGNDSDTLFTETTGLNEKNIESSNVVCFSQGMLISTNRGDVPVERLQPGDRLCTMNAGYATLRWVGHFCVPSSTLKREERLRPIRIIRGALGPAVPTRDLAVSPQHRILVQSPIAQRLCGTSEVLIPAKKLSAIAGVDRINTWATVMYFHLLLDTHEVLFSNGAGSESMYLGQQTLNTLRSDQRIGVAAALHLPSASDARHRPARLFLNRQQTIDQLIARHQKNNKPFQASGYVNVFRSPNYALCA